MALVEITSGNVFAGANLRKLEVGAVFEVDDATAARWKATGKAKDTDKKKGEKLFDESSTVASPQSGDLQEQLAAVTKSRDEAMEQVSQFTEQAAKEKAAFDAQLAAMTKRAEDAEAALAEATKKAK
ncbi:hypothetical protein [Enterobacter hormaechei]|uniref:hypothetical protein n=1 Tax=Enterobacter hormaechei TaxID=158836 RepID=UPI0007939BDD|nr:hypothetical protein [Enterobacter hormaechei]SAC88620.1 Uncharacterised protein [Enterobacter hormaechei]